MSNEKEKAVANVNAQVKNEKPFVDRNALNELKQIKEKAISTNQTITKDGKSNH